MRRIFGTTVADDRPRAFYDAVPLSPRESERCYHQLIKRYYAFLVPPVGVFWKSVADWAICWRQSTLRAGVGVDFSPASLIWRAATPSI